MASITSIGVGSGLDLENLVDQIIASERDPVENRLTLRETQVEASISALGSLKSTLSEFSAALGTLQDPDFFDSRLAVSGDESIFTVSAGAGADTGSYDIAVLAKAGAHKLVSGAAFSSPTEAVGAGTLTISRGGQDFDFSVATGDGLDSLRDQINAADIGVRASLLTVDAGMGDGSTVTRFVLAADNTGAANELSVSVDEGGLAGENTDATGLSRLFFSPGDAGSQMNELVAASDAQITVDGFSAYSASNDFTDVIEGVTISVTGEVEDPLNPPSASLDISVDKTQMKGAVETLVAGYNEVMAVFSALTNYDPATETVGLFTGDSAVNGMETRIRRAISDPVAGAAQNFDLLTYLGVSTNRDGSIALDEDKLNSALNERFDDFGALLGGEDGVAGKLATAVDGFLRTGGLFSTLEQGLDTRMDAIDEQREKLEYRLEIVEQRYRSQFAALDILVAQLNQTGDFLLQQLDAAAGIVNNNSDSN